ncbi:Uncharacterised protein [Serratia liquefaciens]|jgi:hypothetical protein|nr:Uncharacterised protein [Serratia liquefaciens]
MDIKFVKNFLVIQSLIFVRWFVFNFLLLFAIFYLFVSVVIIDCKKNHSLSLLS